ncbi:hypothetical protein KUCAC02_013576 [Chaenocephalus aceratus]|uniref:Uncharacterized protein n=1 Tax=Chaenocephalus aceratus TaxID=36190 RepID=A0ACB9WBG1_CHAAC|nr:hypothetical protein KUCAC02_013576 [Chaenocephalus aceratus]
MDRYVLIVCFGQSDEELAEENTCLESVKQIYDNLVDISTQDSVRGVSVFPACSLSGSPSVQRWHFAVQAYQGVTQFCSSDWEELGTGHQKTDSEEEKLSAVESCLSSLRNQEASDQKADQPSPAELLEEAAEGLHLLTDKLPPPGKALLDVLVLGSTEQAPPVKGLLPLLGALKHIVRWHAAKITVVTQHTTGVAESSVLPECCSGGARCPAQLFGPQRAVEGVPGYQREEICVRAPFRWLFSSLFIATQIRDQSPASSRHRQTTNCSLSKSLSEIGLPLLRTGLRLVQLVHLSDLPSFLMSTTQFELNLSGKSMKAKLLLDQLRSLRGKVGALFSLSFIITPIAQPAASQLSSQRWRESIARRPKSLPVPDVELRGESAHYSCWCRAPTNAGSGGCSARMVHSDGQINGAAAMATVSGFLREKSSSGEGLLKRERKVTQVQTLVLKEYLRQKEEASGSTSVPVNDLKVILSVAREQYLKMTDSTLPNAATCLTVAQESKAAKSSVFQTISHLQSDWPERSVLHNIENLQRRRQKRRFGLLGPGSSDSLLGPKDSQKSSSALLDAKELLKHFTSDGLPTAELQPLVINRG